MHFANRHTCHVDCTAAGYIFIPDRFSSQETDPSLCYIILEDQCSSSIMDTRQKNLSSSYRLKCYDYCSFTDGRQVGWHVGYLSVTPYREGSARHLAGTAAKETRNNAWPARCLSVCVNALMSQPAVTVDLLLFHVDGGDVGDWDGRSGWTDRNRRCFSYPEELRNMDILKRGSVHLGPFIYLRPGVYHTENIHT